MDHLLIFGPSWAQNTILPRKNEGPSPRVGVGGKKMKKNKEGKWGSTVENGSGWCHEKSKEMGVGCPPWELRGARNLKKE